MLIIGFTGNKYAPERIILVSIMSKIVAPVNDVSEVRALVEAGAGELYCGLMASSWIKKYSPVCGPNRREWIQPNLTSLKELESLVNSAHKSEVQVSVAVNSPSFSNSQLEDAVNLIENLDSLGVDFVMVADLGLLRRLSGINLELRVHVSSVAGVFNSQTARFYQGLGVDRIILPRHLTLPEIRGIVMNTDGLEYEAFTLFNRCLYSDGFCTLLHGSKEFGVGENMCAKKYGITPEPDDPLIRGNLDLLEKAFHSSRGAVQNLGFTCGLCSLFDLVSWGVNRFKIVGRGKPLWMRVLGVKMMNEMLVHLIKDKPGRAEFMAEVRSIVENTVYEDQRRPCTQYNCFYPEVL